jgi:hypothetical protein
MMAAVFLLSAHQALFAAEPVGKADALTGTVNFERAGKQDVLKPGDPLFLKDRIQTGAGSSAEIVFVDESRMKLAANTNLEITEYLYNPTEKNRQGLVSLAYGKARFAVQDLQEFHDKRFRVQTRTAVVGSRDTDFVVAFYLEAPDGQASGEGLLSALCLENSIIVFSLQYPDRPALLTANMISQVFGVNLPTPPRFITPAEWTSLLSGLEQIGNRNPLPLAPSSKKGAEKSGDVNNPPPSPPGPGTGGGTIGTSGDYPSVTGQFTVPAPGITPGIMSVTSTTTTTTTTTLPPGASPCGGGLMGVGSPCPDVAPPVHLHGGRGIGGK